MKLTFVILASIVGALLLTGVALLIGWLLRKPAEMAAESKGLSPSEEKLFFPSWMGWMELGYLFFLGGFLLEGTVIFKSVNWLAIGCGFIFTIAGSIRYGVISWRTTRNKLRKVAISMFLLNFVLVVFCGWILYKITNP